MTRRWRIFWGALIILLWLPIYVLCAFVFMNNLPTLPQWLQLLLALVLGVVWVVPLKPLFKWMGRGRASDS